MAPSRMVPAVLAATAIHMVHLHLSHYLTGGQGLLDGLWEDKTFATFWETQIQAIDAKSPANNNTLTLPDGTANGTAVAAEPHPAAAAAALFSAAWLVELLGTFAAGIAVYYWSVGVERAFPARPRGVAVVAGKEKTGLLSEDREEEVVKQWIAQGRVRRSSLSWCNTFAKWLLTMTLGVALEAGARQTVETLAKQQLPFASGGWQIPLAMMFGVVDFFFSLGPVALLLSLIFVPAPQRIVFVNAVHLLGMVFFVSAVRTLVPWVVKNDFVQALVANMTEKVNQDMERDMLVEKARLLDEL